MGPNLGLRRVSKPAPGTDLCEVNLQETKVQHAALGKNLDHGAAVVHAGDDELTARLGVGPAPRGGARLATVVGVGGAEGGVVDEVVQVHVLAPELVERVARNGLGEAVDTLGVVEPGPLGRVHETGLVLGLPEVLSSC